MSKPNIPNMPGAMDTLEFVKSLWGGMGIPGTTPPAAGMPGMSMPGANMAGMAMPTLSLEEIHKRIADLKAVETWLGLNMNMLRSTIQALEVQAATIATLQSMGNAFAATMGGASAAQPQGDGASGNGHAKAESTAGADSAAAMAAPMANAAAWWNMLQNQFTQAVTNAMAGQGMPGAASDPGAGQAGEASPGNDEAGSRKRKPAK